MKPKIQKGPLGQDLTPGQLVTRAALEAGRDIVAERMVEYATETAKSHRLAGIELTAHHDRKTDCYTLKASVLGVRVDGEVLVFAGTVSINAELMEDHKEVLFDAVSNLYRKIEKEMDRKDCSASRAYLKGITRSVQKAQISFNEMSKQMRGTTEFMSTWDEPWREKLDETAVQLAIASIMRSAQGE